MKEIADDNFKFDVNGGKFSERIENTVGKGEIALFEQFLLFQQCFQRLVLQTCENQGLFGKGLNLCGKRKKMLVMWRSHLSRFNYD